MSETLDQLGKLINAMGMKLGNFILKASGAEPIGGGYQLGADSSGKLEAADATTGTKVHAHQTASDGALPALKITQADYSEELINVNGTASEGDVYQTLVTGASTSLTTRGFLRIKVTADNAVMSTGFYYIPFGNIT
jgi:hypothetical protein